MQGNTLLAMVVAVVAIILTAIIGAVLGDVFINTGLSIAPNGTLTTAVSNEVGTQYPKVIQIILAAVIMLVLITIAAVLIRSIASSA